MARAVTISAVWLFVLVLFCGLFVYPQVNTASKLLHLASVMLLIAIPLAALWARTRWRYGILGICGMGVVLVSSPGHGQADLRMRYVATLKAYAGVPYVWGGKTERVIDCSGLLRRAYIRTFLVRGVGSFDGALIRQALAVWWCDCSAMELMDGYRGLTSRIGGPASLEHADYGRLKPGDLAVTADGLHCLAYLGDGCWIDADPDLMRVSTLHAARDASRWLLVACQYVRWNSLSRLDP